MGDSVTRRFIGTALAASALAAVLSPSTRKIASADSPRSPFPIHCVAYVDPSRDEQAGQESVVARYPLAIITQASRSIDRQWRDQVRELSPSTKLLAYQMVGEETTVPGPGHNVLRRLKDAWIIHPDGSIPRVQVAVGKQRRIYDVRDPRWRSVFLEASMTTLESYPFSGLFLDQCTIHSTSHPHAFVRAEMQAALQEVLLELRRLAPSAILIGNSKMDWSGLNGEMLEGPRASRMGEILPFSGHAKPEIQLLQRRLKDANEVNTVRQDLALASSLGLSYGASVNYQQVLWFKEFENFLQ